MWLQATTAVLPTLLFFANTASSQSDNVFALRFDQHVANDKPCPQACGSNQDASNWGVFPSPESLATCSEPVLVDYNLYADFSKPATHKSIRACTLGNAASKVNFLQDSGYVDPDALGDTNFQPPPLIRRASSSNVTCGTGAARHSEISASLASWGAESDRALSKQPKADLQEAITSLVNRMQTLKPDCEKTIAFIYVRGTLVGIYAGAQIDERKSSSAMLEVLLGHLETSAEDKTYRAAVEVCGKGKTAGLTFGAVADASGDFAFVQKTMRTWNEAKCASSDSEQTKVIKDAAFYAFDPPPILEARQITDLGPRAECRSIRVEAGEECADLAKRCGLAGFAFENFNKGTSNFCSTLTEGQPVCCSSGTLPDITPKPGTNGACATYDVKSGEGCQVIANKHGISIKDIEEFNKKTWGWFGCEDLQKAQKICVSKGSAPMPAPVSNAVCGPTANNTDGSPMKPPSDGTDLADMNPCPLDVCCNIWGQCGTSEDFCIISKSPTGAPGTSKPGENGCVSNCGMEIVNDSVGPSQYRKIGYFEAWNQGRPCLNMHVLDIDSTWTHVHFAFGEISNGLDVVIPDDQKEQWDAFVGASKFPKKVLAFGGWAFSNEGSNSGLFRKAVSPSGRATFADNVVKFAVANKLDGVDFDWEYPGADDIEGSTPGEKDDGENYYQFLKLVREKLPKDMTVSIAAPASYWYLRGFPIKKMAPVLDYIVYMTYDLHGQWDVGNEWASPGCPAGNCLRSHVNSTETHQALVMITKASVPSHKVVVGVSSYGRSFKMSDANCRGPQCTFLGKRNESPAKKGRCTETGGYISDFEINEIIKKGGLIKSWYDEETDSDYLVYEGTEWLAYMSKLTKSRRTLKYKNMNFGGTSDWAIDLQGEGSGGDSNSSGRPVYLDPKIWETPSAKCQPPCLLVFPPSKLPQPTTIASRRYTSSLEYGATGKTTISGKETTAFVTKTYSITVTVPAITVTSMSFSNVNITSGQDSTDIFALPSIKIAPIPVRVPDGEGGTTTRNVTLPPWPGSTGGGGGSNPSETDPITDGPPPTTNPGVTNPPPQPTGAGDDDDDDDDLPVWTTWPPGAIQPTSEDIKEPKGNKTPCNLWFFSMCLKKSDPVGGFIWHAPPGKYPPGPPPPNVVNPPEGFTIQPPLPPWPSIKIGKDGVPTYSDKPTCETESASLCSTTTILSVTTIGQSTSTTTKTSSDCETIYGCSLTDWETATTTRTDSCPLPTQPSRRSRIEGRQSNPPPDGCTGPALIIPRDPENVGQIPQILKNNNIEFETVQFATIDFVALYHVPMLSRSVFSNLTSSKDVEDVYYYLEWNQKTGPLVVSQAYSENTRALDNLHRRKLQKGHDHTVGYANSSNLEAEKRQSSRAQHEETNFLHLIAVSDPPKPEWPTGTPIEPYEWHWDDAAGEGQFVYMAYDTYPWKAHDELIGIPGGLVGIQSDTQPFSSIDYHESFKMRFNHPTAMGGLVAGKTGGVCRKCTLVYTQERYDGGRLLRNPERRDYLIHQLIAIYDDISLKGRAGRTVINLSFGYDPQKFRQAMLSRMRRILRLLDEKLQAVLVTCAGNELEPVSELPALFGDPNDSQGYGTIPNMIVVGGTRVGDIRWNGAFADWLTTHAPAESIPVPWDPAFVHPELGTGWNRIDGSSASSAVVAGIAAYYRSVPSPWQANLADPAKVKNLIKAFNRRLTDPMWRGDPVVWNGQVKTHSCLRDYDTRPEWDDQRNCPDLDADLNASPPSWGDSGGSDGGSGGSNGKRINWDRGTDSPKCPSGTCGGEVCSGYYCGAMPNGEPPDFRDPKDPNRAGGPNIGIGDPPPPQEPPEEDDDGEDEDDTVKGYGVTWYRSTLSGLGGDASCLQELGTRFSGDEEVECEDIPKGIAGFTGYAAGDLQLCVYENPSCEFTKLSASVSGSSSSDESKCFASPFDEWLSFKVTKDKDC